MGGLTSINNLKINPMVSQHIIFVLFLYEWFLLFFFLKYSKNYTNISKSFLTNCFTFILKKIYRDRKNKTATLKCRICAQGFELSPINYLMQPIDVFCSWIDELEESQRGGAGINADTSEDDDDDLIGTHGRTDILA